MSKDDLPRKANILLLLDDEKTTSRSFNLLFSLKVLLDGHVFSFIFLSQIETITAFEEAVTHNALELLNIDSYPSAEGLLYVRTINEWISFPFSAVAQLLLFLIFFLQWPLHPERISKY